MSPLPYGLHNSICLLFNHRVMLFSWGQRSGEKRNWAPILVERGSDVDVGGISFYNQWFVSAAMDSTQGIICLFDVDGTLTKPRNAIKPEFLQQLLALQSRIPIAVVSGSDFSKVAWQLGGEPVMEKFGYVFSENGLVVHRFGKLIQSTSIVDHLGEDLIQKFINYALGYMSKLELPRKRGTFVEFRKGLINICPIGRSCTQAERDEFAEYDDIHQIREHFVEDMKRKFGHTDLQFAIGGQISIDVFPKGWDKRYCLQFLSEFPKIHFFGDRTTEGGNDYEVFSDPRTVGHTVQSPEDTSRQLRTLFPSP